MTRKALKTVVKEEEPNSDFPYAELEFTKPADELINIIEQYLIRIKGEKPTRDVVLKLCNVVLENRK